MAKLLLIDDDGKLRAKYKKSLIRAGFQVIEADDGNKLENLLTQMQIDIILSDTEMGDVDGDAAVRRAVDKGLIKEGTMIMGMSEVSNNEDDWKGVAHMDCFYEKKSSRDIGEFVKGRYHSFLYDNPAFFRRKMLEMDW